MSYKALCFVDLYDWMKDDDSEKLDRTIEMNDGKSEKEWERERVM